MGPLIDVAPDAERQPLARELCELVRSNVIRDAAKRADFDRLRGAVAIVADDHATALTLRFDFGRLVVHTGLVGVPDVTIRGPAPLLECLGDVPRRGTVGLLARVIKNGNSGAILELEGKDDGEHRDGHLKIYGFWTHPVFVKRLLSVLSRGT